MLREVVTKYGRVKGLPAADPRITSFKGIPFAKPPVGERRWTAPEFCDPWEGTLEAYAFKAISVQDRPGLGTDIYCREWHVDSEVEISEDCLYLNVWTPAKKTDEKLPVLVWYFGGGLQWGYPSEMEFDGERLARRGIIVVTVNYRLNVFGFLSHPEITKENPDKPTNFGYLDQQLATRWVKENIEAFGGDPENITIAGQSAGGGSVMAQLTNPVNQGLFQRAIVMSGVIGSPYLEAGFPNPPSLADAEKYGEEYFALLGVKNLEEARKLSQDVILSKYNEFVRNHGRLFGTRDDKFIFGDAAHQAHIGKIIDVPIMAGNTEDEFLNAIKADNEAELGVKASELFGEAAVKFLEFPEAHEQLNGRFATVSGIELSVKAIFEQRKKQGSKNNFYYYRFNPDIPGEDNPGTFHSCDLWFFFETLAKCSRPYVGRHYDLARQMANYWANYIKCGNPNGNDADGTAMTEWIPYTEDKCIEMEFTGNGPVSKKEEHHEYKKFLKEQIKRQKTE
ncbi:MAG: carboxylesterase family protein [Lachnospiraceae bacterium]|nr:carboxylesterase family protein [Lachnospiraceae bacterium]